MGEVYLRALVDTHSALEAAREEMDRIMLARPSLTGAIEACFAVATLEAMEAVLTSELERLLEAGL